MHGIAFWAKKLTTIPHYTISTTDAICQAFSKVVSLSGLIKPNILLVLSQANLLLMLAIVCSVLCNI